MRLGKRLRCIWVDFEDQTRHYPWLSVHFWFSLLATAGPTGMIDCVMHLGSGDKIGQQELLALNSCLVEGRNPPSRGNMDCPSWPASLSDWTCQVVGRGTSHKSPQIIIWTLPGRADICRVPHDVAGYVTLTVSSPWNCQDLDAGNGPSADDLHAFYSI